MFLVVLSIHQVRTFPSVSLAGHSHHRRSELGFVNGEWKKKHQEALTQARLPPPTGQSSQRLSHAGSALASLLESLERSSKRLTNQQADPADDALDRATVSDKKFISRSLHRALSANDEKGHSPKKSPSQAGEPRGKHGDRDRGYRGASAIYYDQLASTAYRVRMKFDGEYAKNGRRPLVSTAQPQSIQRLAWLFHNQFRLRRFREDLELERQKQGDLMYQFRLKISRRLRPRLSPVDHYPGPWWDEDEQLAQALSKVRAEFRTIQRWTHGTKERRLDLQELLKEETRFMEARLALLDHRMKTPEGSKAGSVIMVESSYWRRQVEERKTRLEELSSHPRPHGVLNLSNKTR